MKKELKNYMTIEIPSRNVNVSLVTDMFSLFIKQTDPTSEALNDTKTAIKEAITNAIVFAYPDEIGKISIKLSIFENNLLEVKVRDWGCGIRNIEEARTPLFTTGGDKTAGLGFTVMESFMDKVTVRSTIGKGTIVTMKKYIQTKGIK